MVFVVRLDGPDLKTITRMVEDAIATEKSGLEGQFYGDAQGLDSVTGLWCWGRVHSGGNRPIFRGRFCFHVGHETGKWKQPTGGVGNQAAGAAFYLGWYDYVNFQDIFGEKGLARGSIAWHIASRKP